MSISAWLTFGGSPGLWTTTAPWRSAMNIRPSGAQVTFTGVAKPVASTLSLNPTGSVVARAGPGASVNAAARIGTNRTKTERTDLGYGHSAARTSREKR